MKSGQFLLSGRNLLIAVPSGASETVSFAADQLAHYLAVITGSRFRVQEGEGDIRLDVDDGERVTPGVYAIRITQDAIAITGSDELGLLHGVYHFLEAKCGCRWLATFEGGEVVPRDTELSLAPCEERHAPVFSHRAFTNFPDIDERTVEMVDWMCKNRFNRFMVFANMEGSFERYEQVLKPHLALRGMKVEMGHHSFRYWLPPDEFFEDHPEWYAQIKGERRTDAQLCTANPEVAEVVAERISEFLGEHPEIDMVGLWPNDGYGWCECDACLKLEEQRPSELRAPQPARTDTYMKFVSQVAELVGAQHPDRRLSALAYVSYVEPPTVDVPDNVAVCFAAFTRCVKHPLNAPPECVRDNACYAEMFSQWRNRVRNDLYLFCYLMLIDTCSLPNRITPMLGPNFQWLAEHGCDGYVMEFKPEEWGPFGVNGHLIGQLSWNPDLDVDAWLSEYYGRLYGPAVEEMSSFWEAYMRDFVEPGPCVYHYDLTYTRRATHELLLPALNHLGRARAVAATGEKRHWEAVERAHISIELLLRTGEWQRACAEVESAEGEKRQALVERVERLGEDLAAWAKAHGDANALSAPRIEVIVRRTSEAMAQTP